MRLLFALLVGALAGLIFYWVATALVTFNHSNLIFGLVGLAIFVYIGFFSGITFPTRRGRGGPPVV